MTTYDGRSKNYVPGRVAPNKEPPISKHIVEKSYRIHRKRINEAKSIVDTHIEIPDFLVDRSWKHLVKQEKDRMLLRENEEIFKRLNKIENKNRTLSNLNPPSKSTGSLRSSGESLDGSGSIETTDSLNKQKKLLLEMNETERHILRAQEQAKYFKKLKEKERSITKLQIQKDNEFILKRIQGTKSLYGLDSMKEWYKKHERFKNTRSFDPTAGHIMTNMKGLLPPPLKTQEPFDISSISSTNAKNKNARKYLSSSTSSLSSISSSASYQDQFPLLSLTDYYSNSSQPIGFKQLPSISSNSSLASVSSSHSVASKNTYSSYQSLYKGPSNASISSHTHEYDGDNDSLFSIPSNHSLSYSHYEPTPKKKKSFSNISVVSSFSSGNSSSGNSVGSGASSSSKKKKRSLSKGDTDEDIDSDYHTQSNSSIPTRRSTMSNGISVYNFPSDSFDNEEEEMTHMSNELSDHSDHSDTEIECFNPASYAAFLEEHEMLCTIPLTVQNYQTTSFYVNAYTKKMNFNDIIKEFYNKGKNRAVTPSSKNKTPFVDNSHDSNILDQNDDFITFTVTHPSSIYQNINNVKKPPVESSDDTNSSEGFVNSSNFLASINSASIASATYETLPIIVRTLKVTDALKIIHSIGTNKKIIHSIESEDLQSLSALLINMFNTYNKDNSSGGLRYEDFHKLMDNIELGISNQELRYVISDIDENNNGIIEFNEFVPLAVDLILSFRARNKAKIVVGQENIVLNQLINNCLESNELHNISNVSLGLLHKYDIKKSGTIRINEFKKVLNEIVEMNIGLDEVEVPLMISYMPQNQYKRIQINHPTLTFFNVLVRIRLINWKYQLMMKQDSNSGLQRYLWNLCYEEEKRLYYNSNSYNVNTTASATSSNTNTESSSIFTDDFIPKCELPVHNIICLLSNSARLSLSRLQVFVLMSDTAGLITSNQDIISDCGLNLYGINEEDSLYKNMKNGERFNDHSSTPIPSEDSSAGGSSIFFNNSSNSGMINYLVFIPLAARAIEYMFEPKTLRQRAELIEKTDLSSRALLNNMLEAQKEKKKKDLKRISILAPPAANTSSSINSIRRSRSLSISQHLMQIDINMDEGTPQVNVVKNQNSLTNSDGDSPTALSISSPKNLEQKTAHEKFISRLYTLFRSYDIDHNHLLDPNEFQSCLYSLDLQLSHTEIVALATVADRNQFGYLQFDDFSHFFYTHLLGLEKEKRIRVLIRDLEDSNLIDNELIMLLEQKDKSTDTNEPDELKPANFTKLVSVANDLVVERSIFLQQFIEIVELFDTSQEKTISNENLFWILKRFDLSTSKFVKEYLSNQLHTDDSEDVGTGKVYYFKSIKFWDQFIRVLRAKQYLTREIFENLSIATIKAQNRYKALAPSSLLNSNNEAVPLPVAKLISKFKDLNEAFNLGLYNIISDRFNEIIKFLNSQHSHLTRVEINYFLALNFYKIVPNVLLIPRLNCTSSNMKYNSKYTTNMNSNVPLTQSNISSTSTDTINSDSSHDDSRFKKRVSKQIPPLQLPIPGAATSVPPPIDSAPSNASLSNTLQYHASSLVSLPFSPTSVEIIVENIVKFFNVSSSSNSSTSNTSHFRNLKCHIGSKQIEESYLQAKKFAIRYNHLMDISNPSSYLINQVYNTLQQYSNSNKKLDAHLESPYISLRDVYSALTINRVSTYTDSELLNMLSFFENSMTFSLCSSGNYDPEILFEQGIGLDIYEVSESIGLMMRHLELISHIECESRVNSFNTILQKDVKNILEEAYDQVYNDYVKENNEKPHNIPIVNTTVKKVNDLSIDLDEANEFKTADFISPDFLPTKDPITPKNLMRKQGSFNHHLQLLHQSLTPTNSKLKSMNSFNVDSPENIIEKLALQEKNMPFPQIETIMSKPSTPNGNVSSILSARNPMGDVLQKGQLFKYQLQEVLERCKNKLKLSQHSIDSIIVTIFSTDMNIVNWNDIIFTLVDLARMHSAQHPNKTRLSTIILNKNDETTLINSPVSSLSPLSSKSSFSIPHAKSNDGTSHYSLMRSPSKGSFNLSPIIHLDPTSSLVSLNLAADSEENQNDGNSLEDNTYNINKLFESKINSLKHISEKIVNFSKLFIIPSNQSPMAQSGTFKMSTTPSTTNTSFNKLFLSFPSDLLYKDFVAQSLQNSSNNEQLIAKSTIKNAKSSILLRKIAYVPFIIVEFLSEKMAIKNPKFNANLKQTGFNFHKLIYTSTNTSSAAADSSLSESSMVFHEYSNHISDLECLSKYKVVTADLDQATLRARANSSFDDNSGTDRCISTPSSQPNTLYYIALKTARPLSSSMLKQKQYSIVKRYTCTFVPVIISVQSMDDNILNLTKSITISLTNSDCSIHLKKELPYRLSSLSEIDNSIANQYIKNIISNIYIEKLNNHAILTEEDVLFVDDFKTSIVINE